MRTSSRLIGWGQSPEHAEILRTSSLFTLYFCFSNFAKGLINLEKTKQPPRFFKVNSTYAARDTLHPIRFETSIRPGRARNSVSYSEHRPRGNKTMTHRKRFTSVLVLQVNELTTRRTLHPITFGATPESEMKIRNDIGAFSAAGWSSPCRA